MANFTDNPRLGTAFKTALEFAFNAHLQQVRKDPEQTPYFAHLMAVASLVLEAGGDEPTAIAALLHDTVEDTLHTFQEIEEVFGSSVAKLIREVSEDKEPPKTKRKEDYAFLPVKPMSARKAWLPKIKRKEDYAFRISTMSKEAVLIVLADKLHNLRCIAQGQAPALVNSTTQTFYKLVCDELLDRCVDLNNTGNEQLSELIRLYNQVFE